MPAPIDGLASPVPEKKSEPPKDPKTAGAVKRFKMLFIVLGSTFYLAYLVWCFALTTLLPSPTGGMQGLLLAGIGSSLLAGIIFLGIAVGGFFRVSGAADVPLKQRKVALIKVALLVIPGLIASGATPFLITREPPFSIDITNPVNAQNMVAPVTITLSVQRAVDLLAQSNLRFIQYKWDINGDGKSDQTTTTPQITFTIDKEGIYNMSVTMIGNAGLTRRANKRIIMQNAVFSVTPSPVIVEQPAIFNVSNLVQKVEDIDTVEWDFTGDGKPDDTTKGPETTYTFYQLGSQKVSVTIKLINKAQGTYQRTIDVTNPEPLPFPVTIDTTPRVLVSPAPFSVLFNINTKTPIAEVQWNFADGTKDAGNRVLHTFDRLGNYFVTAKVRSLSGSSATINTLVRVLQDLQLPDLTFESNVPFNGFSVSGPVPLRLDVTPKTNAPFVQFSWETPDASESGSRDKHLQAVYRKQGTYTVTLVGQDLANHAMRRDITVTVGPPDTNIDFTLTPDNGVAPLKVMMDATPSVLPPDDPVTGYEWSCGAALGSVPGGGISSCSYDQEGTYRIRLVIRTQSGKEYSKEKTLLVRPAVLSACFISSSKGKIGVPVKFDPTCTTGEWTRMIWDFGDGSQLEWKQEDAITGALPSHAFDSAGTYTVNLIVYDALGRLSKAKAGSVTVSPPTP